MRAQYGYWIARVMCTRVVRQLWYLSLEVGRTMVIRLIQAYVIAVLITLLRCLVALVVYTFVIFSVGTVLWVMLCPFVYLSALNVKQKCPAAQFGIVNSYRGGGRSKGIDIPMENEVAALDELTIIPAEPGGWCFF